MCVCVYVCMCVCVYVRVCVCVSVSLFGAVSALFPSFVYHVIGKYRTTYEPRLILLMNDCIVYCSDTSTPDVSVTNYHMRQRDSVTNYHMRQRDSVRYTCVAESTDTQAKIDR